MPDEVSSSRSECVCVRIVEALKDIEHLKENFRDLRDQHRKLSDELRKKSEEIKDTFNVAEKTRIAFEEHAELYLEKLENMETTLSSANKKLERFDDSRYKTLFTVLKGLGAAAAIALVILSQMGYL